MSDFDAVFDTKQVRQQVQEFEKSVNSLTASLGRLDRTNLATIQGEIDRLSKQGSSTLQQSVSQLKNEFNQLQAALNSPRGNQAWYTNVEQGVNKLKLAVAGLKEQTGMYHMEARNSSRNAALYMTQNAFKMAQDTKAVFTDLRTFKHNIEKAEEFSFKASLRSRINELNAAGAEMKAIAAKNAASTDTLAGNKSYSSLSSSYIRKSAEESAAAFEAAFKASANAKSMGMLNAFFNQHTGKSGPVAYAAKDAAATFKAVFAAESALTKGTGFKLGGAEIMGAYTPYNAMTAGATTATAALRKEQQALGAQSAALGGAFKKLTVDGNDLHSMSRGLASGFNLLWLTWGNLVPLFIGAGISNGFMQVVKAGTAVEQTMATIQHLGGATAAEMGLLNGEMLRLAKSGPAGPIEIAEAMKTLSLAGLKANDILSVTQDVLNFSVAGTTDIKTAADTLVSVSTAFGLGAAGFGRVSDVIAKASAESKTSVEGMAAAMRSASVIGKQYKVSLEDTATSLAAMSQLGIDFSAAGTALRNMYADLSGRSEKTSKILKSQGIELRDLTTGGFKPLLTVVGELDAKIKNFKNGAEAKNFLQALLSERGGKAIIELLDLINQKATDTGKSFKNMLDQLQGNISDSAAFSAIAAAKMANTLENQFKGVKATLQASFVEIFQDIAPDLTIIADNLKKVFASEEFKSTLGTMVEVIGRLLVAVSESASALMTLGVVMAGVKVSELALGAAVSLGVGARAAYTAAIRAGTVETAANSAANAANAAGLTATAGAATAATAASTGLATSLGLVKTALAGLNILIGIATAAWVAYEFFSKKANNSTVEAAKVGHENIKQQLQKQIDDLNKVNKLRQEGLSLEEAQAATRRKTAVDESLSGANKIVAEAQANVDKVQADIDKYKADVNSYTGRKLAADLERATGYLEAAKAKRGEMADELKSLEDQLKSATETQNKLNAAAIVPPIVPHGDETFGKPTTGKPQPVAIPTDNSLTLESKALTRQLAEIKRYNDDYSKLLAARHSAGTITEGAYQAELFALSQKTDRETLAAMEIHSARQFELIDARASMLQSKLKEAAGKNNDVAIEKIQAELDNLARSKADILEKNDAEKGKILADTFMMVAIASEKAAGEVKKLRDADREFWKKDRTDYEKLVVAQEVEKQFAFMSDSILSSSAAEKAAYEARSAAMVEYTAHIDDMRRQLSLAADAANEFLLKNLAAISTGDETATAMYNRLRKTQADIEALIASSESQTLDAANRRSEQAFTAMRERQARELTGSVADALVTGLTEGGTAGRKKFRSLLEAELRKPLVALVNVGVNLAISAIGGLLGLSGGGSGGASGGGGGGIGTLINGASLLGKVGGTFGMGLSSGFGALMGEAGLMGGIDAGMIAMGAGNIMGGLGTLIGTLGPIALAVGALFSIISSLDDSGTYHTGGSAQYSAANGLETSSTVGYNTGMGEVVNSDETRTAVGSVVKGLTTAFDAFDKAFGGKGGYEVAGSFADDTSEDGAWGGFRISKDGKSLVNWEDTRSSKWAPKEFADGEEGYKQFLAAIAKDSRNVLLEMDMPEWAKKALRDLGEAPSMEELQTTLATIGQIQTGFDSLGAVLTQFGEASDEAKYAILEAAGGIDALTSAAKSYYTNFYSAEEQRQNSIATLQKAFTSLGLNMPDVNAGDARSQFRALVESLDLSTESGQKAYAALMALSGVFAEVTKTSEELAQAERDRQAALAEANATAWAKALQRLEDAINAEKEKLQESIGKYQETVNTLTSVFDKLKSEVADLYGEIASTSSGAFEIARQTIRKAMLDSRNGTIIDGDLLDTALSDFKDGLDPSNYKTQFEYDRDRLIVASQLAQLRDNTGSQLTAAEAQLKAANDAVDKLDETLAYWRKQVAIADGTYRATLSVADAMNNLYRLLTGDTTGTASNPSGASSGQAVFGGTPTGSKPTPTGNGNLVNNAVYRRLVNLGTSIGYQAITDDSTIARLDSLSSIYHSFDGTGDLTGLLTAIRAAGGTMQDLSDLSGYWTNDWQKAAAAVGIPAFARGGSHSGGIRLVGEEGPELEVTGPSRIFNARQTAEMLSSGYSPSSSSDNSASTAMVLDEIRRELVELRKIHRRWDTEGVPEQRVL